MEYRTGSHTRYSIFYHIVIIPKYRRDIIHGRVEDELKRIIREMSEFHDWIIKELESNEDHLHIFLSTPPRQSPAEIVKLLKTWTYTGLYHQYPEIKQKLWGGKLWSRGYFVTTVNDKTTKEQIARYVRNQKKSLQQPRLLWCLRIRQPPCWRRIQFFLLKCPAQPSKKSRAERQTSQAKNPVREKLL